MRNYNQGERMIDHMGLKWALWSAGWAGGSKRLAV